MNKKKCWFGQDHEATHAILAKNQENYEEILAYVCSNPIHSPKIKECE